jgi:hypothetical protein
MLLHDFTLMDINMYHKETKIKALTSVFQKLSFKRER